MPFACIYVPNFPRGRGIARRARARAHGPVAILEGKPPLEIILAVNDQASRLGIAPGMTKPQSRVVPRTGAAPKFCAAKLRRPRRLARLHPILLTMRGGRGLRHRTARSRRDGISAGPAAPDRPRPPRPCRRPRTRCLYRRSFQSRHRRARRPRIMGPGIVWRGHSCPRSRHRNSSRQRSRPLRALCRCKFCSPIAWKAKRKKNQVACSKLGFSKFRSHRNSRPLGNPLPARPRHLARSCA